MQIKSNKGIVGTDISIGLIVLVLFVAIATAIFSQIGKTNTATTRHAIATNYAVDLLERIQSMSYEDFQKTELDKTWYTSEGIQIPNGYTVTIEKNADPEKDEFMQEVTVKVAYNIQQEAKEVCIKTLKTR